MSKRKEKWENSESPAFHNPILADRLKEKGFIASDPEETAVVPEPVGKPPLDLSRAGKIVLSRERKGRGGKTATLVNGLGLPAVELERLARELRKALGCGATVEEGAIVLQGDIAPRVRTWLQEHGATKVAQGN